MDSFDDFVVPQRHLMCCLCDVSADDAAISLMGFGSGKTCQNHNALKLQSIMGFDSAICFAETDENGNFQAVTLKEAIERYRSDSPTVVEKSAAVG